MRTNEIPYWEKYMLTLREAAEYFHIGEKKSPFIIHIKRKVCKLCVN